MHVTRTRQLVLSASTLLLTSLAACAVGTRPNEADPGATTSDGETSSTTASELRSFHRNHGYRRARDAGAANDAATGSASDASTTPSPTPTTNQTTSPTTNPTTSPTPTTAPTTTPTPPATATAPIAPTTPAAPPPGGLALKVVGNQLHDANDKPIRLLGVNRSGTEFKCIQTGTPGNLGWGIIDGPNDLASAQAIGSWHANAVRVPLNEDCWLGINGVNPAYAGANYRAAITSYVNTLHQAGLYVIVDLHWTSPGTIPAVAQQPMPDADHAVDFWTSVASTFASDPAVVFDLFNEPFLYGSYFQNPSQDAWSCWLNGCGFNQYVTGGTPYTQMLNWNAVGMQTLVNTVRATGAKNVIMVGGMDWANDLSGWLAHMPSDPQHQLAASWHAYPGNTCNTAACRTSVVEPLAAQVPIVIGETGDNICGATTYVDSLLPWADSMGISYLGWTWNTWGGCENVLITSYAGAPTTNYGQRFHDLLAVSATKP